MSKRFYTIVLVFFSFIHIGLSQDVILSSQEEVDAFDVNLTSIQGNLTIEGDDIVDLANLINLTNIEGNLLIEDNFNLQSLEGLANIITVGGDFIIEDNFNLQNLLGLENIISVGGNLEIEDNDALQNLGGLANINSIGGSLNIVRNDEINNLIGLSNITSLGGDLYFGFNDGLQNLDEFTNLTSIGGDLWLRSNIQLKNIDGLINLSSIGNNLRIQSSDALLNINGLENVSSNLGNLGITGNALIPDLNSLSKITTVEGSLSIFGNVSLQNLNGLSNITTVGATLQISRNNLIKNLDSLSKITSTISKLEILQNFTLENLDGLSKITSIQGEMIINFNDALQNVDGLRNITSVGSNIELRGNDVLQNLDGLSKLVSIGGSLVIREHESLESVTGLLNIATIGEDLIITSNTNLTNCCVVKNLIVTPYLVEGLISIHSNSFECNYFEIFESNCDNYPSAKGCMFWDKNKNGIKESEERTIQSIPSLISPDDIFTFTDSSGCFSHFLENGSYIIRHKPTALWQLTSDSSEYQINVNDDSNINLDFGFFPIDSTLAGWHHTASGITRCNREVIYDFNFRNLGNTIVDGRLYIELDSETELSSFVDPADTIINDKIWEWHYENVYPGELIQRRAILKLPSVDIESISIFSAASAKTDFHPEIFFKSNYEAPILCAYDPNDKLVSPDRAGDENYTLFEDTLTYTVRFQNTGNDTAFTVVIRDTLDQNLDPSTFTVIASSHQSNLRSEMSQSQYLTFSFDNILLPDSTTNFNGSQGYITYTILPKEGLDENTIIENTASIYFDFNPPIVTNTTQNTMVSCLPIEEEVVQATINANEEYTLPDGMVVSESGTYTTDILNEAGCPIETIITVLDVLTSIDNSSMSELVSIYPNPAKNKFSLTFDSQETIDHQLTLTNIYGQVVFSKSIQQTNTEINVGHLASGIYFAQLRNQDNEILVAQRLIIAK